MELALVFGRREIMVATGLSLILDYLLS